MKERLLTVIILYGLMQTSAQAASSDVDFKGTLVAEPCTVATGSDGDNVVVDFGTIAEKTFYSTNGRRTWLQPFHILLKDCDLTLGKTVKTTFTGTEDGEQPGLLAVTSSNGVAHVAIGLQTSDGTDLEVNTATQAQTLSAGSTQLNYKAYVQASDEGVRSKSVGLGTFEAISTFELEYP